MAILLLNSDIQAKAAMLVETVSNILKSNVSVQIIRDPHTTHTHIYLLVCYNAQIHATKQRSTQIMRKIENPPHSCFKTNIISNTNFEAHQPAPTPRSPHIFPSLFIIS